MLSTYMWCFSLFAFSLLHQGEDLSVGLVTTISDTDGLLLPLPFVFFRAVLVG